jgi:hypothetical protein
MATKVVLNNQEVNEAENVLPNLKHSIESRTGSVAPDVIEATEWPHYLDWLDGMRITPPPESAQDVQEAALNAGLTGKKRGYHPALSILNGVLASEKQRGTKVREISDDIKKDLADIRGLIGVNDELISADKDFALTEELKKRITRLKDRGIDIWKGDMDGKITKEQIDNLKSRISSRIETLRATFQNKTNTELSKEIHELQEILEIAQGILRLDREEKRKYLELPR